jgi:DNA-binding transcriptional ArsR family regulator
MVVKWTSSPFGGQTRTRVLLALRLLGDSYARELSRLLETPLSGVQKALRSLELDGLVAGRPVGRTRVYQLNPRYFAADTLAVYLARLAEPENGLRERAKALRRRPRRAGKPL